MDPSTFGPRDRVSGVADTPAVRRRPLAGPVVIATVASRFGPVSFAVTPNGVAALEIGTPPEVLAASLRRRGRGPIVGVGDLPERPIAGFVARVGTLVEATLRGEPTDLGPLPVDLEDRPAWDRLVLGAVRTIPRGAVASYGEIARRIGRTGAARAVGGAVGRNPVGLFVPCHRVIAGDGSLGGYGVAPMGGREAALDLKQALLELEGVTVRR